MTSKARPTPASHAEKTSKISGAIEAENMWKWEMIRAIRINRDNIIPSKHRSVDIRCER